MVEVNYLVVLQALPSFYPHSKHLTLNRTDRIIGTRKATYVLEIQNGADEE